MWLTARVILLLTIITDIAAGVKDSEYYKYEIVIIIIEEVSHNRYVSHHLHTRGLGTHRLYVGLVKRTRTDTYNDHRLLGF